MHVGRNTNKPFTRFVTPLTIAQTESNPAIHRTNRPPLAVSHDIYSSALPGRPPPSTAKPTPPRNAEFTKPHLPPPSATSATRNRSNTTGSTPPPSLLQSVSSGGISRGPAASRNVPSQSSSQMAPLNAPPQLKKPPQQVPGRTRSPTSGPPPGYSPNRSGSEEHIKPPSQPILPSLQSAQSSDTIMRRPKPPHAAPRPTGNPLHLPPQSTRDKPPPHPQQDRVPPLVSPRNNLPPSSRGNAAVVQPMASPRYFQASSAQPAPQPASQPPKRGTPNPRGQPPSRGGPPNSRGRPVGPPPS